MIATGPLGPGDLDAVLASGSPARSTTFAFVHPAARGRGLGTWLLGWAEAAAREIGARACTQSLSVPDAGARALLAAHGYEHVGMHVRKTYTEFAKPL